MLESEIDLHVRSLELEIIKKEVLFFWQTWQKVCLTRAPKRSLCCNFEFEAAKA